MDKVKITNIIENGRLGLYLLKKRTIQDYKVYQPAISSEISNWCKTQHSLYLSEQSDSIRNYDPIISVDGTIEKTDLSTLSGLDKINSKLFSPDNTNNLDVSKIKFILFRYTYNNEEVLIFRRHTSSNRLKNGIFSVPQSGVYKKIETRNFLNFDKVIDLLIFENEAFIFNHRIVESLFFTKELFIQRTESILQNINSHNKIENFDALKVDILNDTRLYKKIARLYDTPDIATLFIEQHENTLETIQNFSLNIEVKDGENEDKIFIYDSENPDNKIAFANLIVDAYFKTIIGNRMGEND